MATFIQNKQNGQQKGDKVFLVGRFAFFASLTLLLLLSVGCEKEANYSDIPEITYLSSKVEIGKDLNENDIWKCTIKFEFKDGDGDVGVDASDKSLKNCFFTQFDRIDGAFVKVIPPNPEANLYYSIPYVEPTGSTKQQKGTISVEIDLLINIQKADTVKYRFYIKDKALHTSDTIETKEIVLVRPQKIL